ncbi:hypothetical protein KYC5002_47760 [Archangium violaceum]|uniref:imm11 family protein n=1 Tax=Archangium violaceum TaxID=83451 RepID=UPI002B31EABE|nr:hypothetical protein KYC5002_47760 [Archangium gephyra]
MDYLVWDRRDEGNSCALLTPEEVERDWELSEGVPRAANFSPDALFRMSDRHKKNTGLTDNLINMRRLIVASARLKDFLQFRALKNVEYLPVSIINHKGKVASSEYFIVHPIHPQECLDLQASTPRYSHINPTDIATVKKLVVDPTKIDPDVSLFKLKNYGRPTLIRRQLADEILKAGFRGVSFLELHEYEP